MNEQVLFNRPTFPARLDMNHPLAKGCRGRWLLNDSGGMRAFDSSPQQNHMNYVGYTTPLKRSFNGALLNGSTQYFHRSVADWRPSDLLGTVLVWFKTSSATAQIFFASCDEGSALYQFAVGIDANGKLQILQINNDAPATDVTGSTVAKDGVFHMATFISNGTAYTQYLDLILQTLTVNTGSDNGDWLADTTLRDNISIGARVRSTTINHLSGTVIDVAYYDYVMPIEFIRWYYRDPYCMFLR